MARYRDRGAILASSAKNIVQEASLKPSVISIIAALGAIALTGCTGGDMGSTRGGGAAPGQSGGRDTAHAPSAGAATPAAAAAAPSSDTTKQRAKAKQP
jgi:hypothetical protein